MPYISKDLKKREQGNLDHRIAQLRDFVKWVGEYDENEIEGVLNYCITRILVGSFGLAERPRYKNLNRAIGVLECVKQELYRRIGGPYEDKAIEKNGDIHEYKVFDSLN